MKYEYQDSYPNSLRLVLKSVKWNNHCDVAKVGITAQISLNIEIN